MVGPASREAAAATGTARRIGRQASDRDSARADHPTATTVSAGMSGDLEDAITAGATHVRVGSAILGARSPRLG